jgi:hypothetical protein
MDSSEKDFATFSLKIVNKGGFLPFAEKLYGYNSFRGKPP